jgi:antitoxin (DNA-binding transcriptional repressor) of toxin-antitoxin stability system
MEYSRRRCASSSVEEGEIVTVLDNGRAIASKVACSNEDCSSHAAPADDDETARDGEECGINECAREKGHTGNHRRRTKPKD